MNRLQLVQRLIYESGATSVTLATTANQRGDALNFVNWVDDAWLEVQGLLNWPALWEQASVTVSAGSSSVAQSLPHKRYEKEYAALTDTVTAQRYELEYLPWHLFREQYRTLSANASPSCWSVRPDRALAFNATMANEATFTCERYRMPGVFTQDTDEPALFSEHHMMIVWRGLMLYAGFDEAGVAYKRAEAEYAKLKRLAGIDLPSLEPGEPLA